ncbi:MAG: T9SS type A sorting domain-containing protein, partial [Tannerella sp.]|nr:T9SS type A sorting domain-containing protein [Tannerella sp.]
YDELYIKGSLEVKSVAVYSLAGKLCKQVRLPEGTNNYSLSFSGLNAGIYILLIETPNGIKSQKVIKM